MIPVVGPAVLAERRDSPSLADCYSSVFPICTFGVTGDCLPNHPFILPSLVLKVSSAEKSKKVRMDEVFA